MNCDTCGKETLILYNTKIEGVLMNVCKDCSSFGEVQKVIRPFNKNTSKKKFSRPIIRKQKEEVMEVIVSNYGSLVKRAREKLNMKQEEVAKQLHEKESLISQIETEHKEPRIELAKKLEKFFKIKLIEVIAEKEVYITKEKGSDQLTIGDMIKIKKR